MSDATAISLKEFVAKTTVVLQATEHNLRELAQLALLCGNQPALNEANSRTEGETEAALRLQQISRHLSDLSERGQTLQFCLQNDLDIPPLNDDHWPRIKVLQSQEEERIQVARTMEDSVGQLLANAVFELASYRQSLDTAGVEQVDSAVCSNDLQELQAELEQGLTNFRQLITELDPTAILNNFGLGGGIRRYLEQYELKTGLNSDLQINTNIGRLPAMIEIAIFRIVQEALDNVYRHARATQVEVIVQEHGDLLQFSITDDGDGLSAEKIGVSRKNLGLARMIDYAELLNGRLRVLSEPGHGTQVILSIPYPAL